MARSADAPGVIEPGNIYTLDEIKARLRLADWAWRRSLRPKLEQHVVKIGRRKYINGDDVIAALRRSAS